MNEFNTDLCKLSISIHFSFRLLNLFGDLEDLEQALKKKNLKKVIGSGSCSALIKLFPNNAELAISHVTWNDFNAMLRIYKRYNMSLHSHPGQGLLKLHSFSSASSTFKLSNKGSPCD